jgi:L-cysteine:1D-myo-inositol 2-amino-2-deoxy-alpha-D-glucopyranoside ligase
MSKSLGNLVLVSRLVAAGEEPTTIRLALLQGHYSEDREYSGAVLDEARNRLALWRRAVAAAPEGGRPAEEAVLTAVRDAVRSNLDSPRALAVVDEWALGVLGGTALPDDGAAAGDRVTPVARPGQDEPGGLVADTVDALLGIELGA